MRLTRASVALGRRRKIEVMRLSVLPGVWGFRDSGFRGSGYIRFRV